MYVYVTIHEGRGKLYKGVLNLFFFSVGTTFTFLRKAILVFPLY